VDEWGTRLAAFEAGDADYIYVPSQFRPQVEEFYGTTYNDVGEMAGDGGGWIQAWTDLPSLAMTPAQFNHQINFEGGNAFAGSGELDGNGIPADFFQDLNIRKAFNYCMDFDTMIADALNGEGLQSQGPIIAGMLGYRNGEAPLYSYDPDKCAEEFQASATGVWDTGFYFQMAYNIGNDTRRLSAEILKAGVEAVNDHFTIEVVGMPWPVLLASRRAGKLPIYVGGWLEDFHDPHNWVHPFLHSTGAYGAVANFTDDIAAEFDALIEEAASLTSADERRPVYEAIQLKAQEDAVMIWLYQGVGRLHFQEWMQGVYYNPAYSSAAYSYVYALDKGQ
jgi:peptide/nickel transport system substrate-binding protein